MVSANAETISVCQRTPVFKSRKPEFFAECPKTKPQPEKIWPFPQPICKLFQIHGSKFKLHPVRNLGQASVLCITHSVFFFGVCKDAFNGLFPLPVKALVLLISEDSCPRIFFIIAGSPALSAFFQTLTLYCCLRPERCFCHTFLCTPQYSGLHRRSRSPG